MKAVRVRKEMLEAVRQRLLMEDMLDKTRKIVKNDGFFEIPVINELDPDLIDQKRPVFYDPRRSLRDILNIPECELELLPSGWQILGNIIIISLKKELENRKAEIATALLHIYPGCSTVLLDRGIYGHMRQPVREMIAGEKTETIHRENGCLFKLDALKLMFSQGNLNEKIRMSRSGKDEIIVDMFAGIGYFSIPMAVHSAPKKIISIEINPLSFHYLKENIKLNKVGGIVEPVLGDCSDVAPCNIAHRVIMGYLDGQEYLQKGISALLPGGVLHYHEAVPEAIERRPVERVLEAAERLGRKAEIMEVRRIKKYSPGVRHVVVDAKMG